MAARQKKPSRRKPTEDRRARSPFARARRWALRWSLRIGAALMVLLLGWVAAYKVVNPPGGFYMLGEYRRIGNIEREWTPISQISPHMPRAVVAAEDANFCLHWGFDMTEIRRALEADSRRGASTITQQTVKNAFLWHGRSWTRKALEAGGTPIVELLWSKRRIHEVYLNIAEFDNGVFGVQAAAQHYFGTSAAELTPLQAARLAAILPAPKSRSAAQPTPFVRARTAAIMDGAATIAADGRAACFED